VTLRLPVQLSHGVSTAVEHYADAGLGVFLIATLSLNGAANVGATSVVLDGVGPVSPGELLRINNAAIATNEEMIYVAAASQSGAHWVVTLRTPLQIAHEDAENVELYNPHGALPGDRTTLTGAIQAGTEIPLVAPNGVFTTAKDLVVFVDTADATRTEARRIGALARATLSVGAYETYAAGWRFEHVTRTDTGPAIILDAAVPAGALTLSVNNRDGLTTGAVIRVGNAADPNVEYVVIRDLPNKLTTNPDPGRIVLEAPLQSGHGHDSIASRQIVARQTLHTLGVETHTGTLALATDPGELHLVLTTGWPAAPTPSDVLQITSRRFRETSRKWNPSQGNSDGSSK
jgi:hypothetical protein